MRAGRNRSIWGFHGFACRVRYGSLVECVVLVAILAGFGLIHVLADGCFVFKWNKAVGETLSSAETVGLITNSTATARLAGLRNLQKNGDAEAVELILPRLTDTNKLVRNRTFFVLRNITGEDVSESEPATWQAWWKANKASFRPRKTVQ